ncbi:MAG: RNA polymerase sigma factor [Pseudomonadota bacterium]
MLTATNLYLDDNSSCFQSQFNAITTAEADSNFAREHEDGLSTDLKRQLIAALPQLRRFARTLTRSVSDADDLVQEACLTALSKSHMWDPTKPLDRWMYRIVRNLWISEMRKQKVRQGHGQVLADETTELVTHESGETSVIHTQLRATIDALPSELSTILLLVSVEGYSYAEAADLLEIPVGTVMSRMHRARRVLAKQLEETKGDAQ